MTAEVPPPPDLSGGYVVLKYTNGTDTHRQRLHVRAFTQGTGGSSNVYTYTTPNSGTSPETTVDASVAAYLQFVKVFYNSTWTWTLDSLFKRTGTAVFVQQFPIPTVSAVAGTGTVEVTGLQRATEMIFNMRTSGGRRNRYVFVAVSQQNPAIPNYVNANPSGNDSEKLIAYVTGNATGIVCHDNTLPVAPSHRTFPYNRRLRRHYGYA